MNRAFFLAPIAVFTILVAVFASGLGRDPSRLPSTLIDRPLPQFDLPPVRTNDIGLKTADVTGRPRLLNVFASWCVSCRVEHPTLLGLKAQGVAIDGLDWKDEPSDGRQYLGDQGDPYRLVGNDRSGRTGIDLGVAGVPETFVVDRRGRVRFKQIGPISPQDWENVVKPIMARLEAER